MSKNLQKARAIELRKEGKTYREILEIVSVAKSSLSIWLRSVGLALPQEQRITQLRKDTQRKGADARRNNRLAEIDDLITKGKEEVGKLSERELWLIGTALYWAEGSKQREKNISSGIMFSNQDFRMIIVFLKWLQMLGIEEQDIYFELYVHRNRKDEAELFKKWWAKTVDIIPERMNRIYFKNGNPTTKRTNIGDLYHGLLRIRVKTSTSLNRQVNGWIAGIAN